VRRCGAPSLLVEVRPLAPWDRRVPARALPSLRASNVKAAALRIAGLSDLLSFREGDCPPRGGRSLPRVSVDCQCKGCRRRVSLALCATVTLAIVVAHSTTRTLGRDQGSEDPPHSTTLTATMRQNRVVLTRHGNRSVPCGSSRSTAPDRRRCRKGHWLASR